MGIKLKEWVKFSHSDEEMTKLFYNMSKTMKYIHTHDHYIKTFNLGEIEILDNKKLAPIQYNTVSKAPKEYLDEIQREDIYNLAFMQIGLYTETLNNLRPQFLKDEFERFTPLLPENDIAYFRGIVTHGARVYYCDYIDEKSRREMVKMGDSISNDGTQYGFQKTKATASGKNYFDKDIRNLYSDINKTDAAFVSFLAFPLLVLALGLILSIVFFLS